jgi:hypothetical protein
MIVHSIRKDGFNNKINLEFSNMPSGFNLESAAIPAGKNKLAFTVSAPEDPDRSTFSPKVIGTADISGKKISRKAVPAEDKMQAFLWRHLVESEDLKISLSEKQKISVSIQVPDGDKVVLEPGGEAMVHVSARSGPLRWKNDRGIFELELFEGPKGIYVKETVVNREEGSAYAILTADKKIVKPGDEGNLIFNAYYTWRSRKKDGQLGKKKYLCTLAAVPYVVK